MDDIYKYYQALELPYNSSLEDVRKKYKDLVFVWHPDRFPGDSRRQKLAEEKIKEINEAYNHIVNHLNNHDNEDYENSKSENENEFVSQSKNENNDDLLNNIKTENGLSNNKSKSSAFKYFLVVITVIFLIFIYLYLREETTSKISPSQNIPPAVGQVAPDFTLSGLDGKTYSLASLRGKVVIVNFWATWCPPCREEMPSMEQLHRELADEGLVILAVNIEKDGRRTVPKLLAGNPHSFPILVDDQETVQKRYRVFKFPESFIVRKDGVIDDKVIGAIDWAHPPTIAYFRNLLKE